MLIDNRDKPWESHAREPLLDNESDTSEDLQKSTEVKLYGRRWYILALFSCLCAAQGGLWNTWGPISESAKFVFGWQDGMIALMSNCGPITYIVCTIGFTWLIDVKGVRVASLVTMALVTAGCGLRCITSSTTYATWLIFAGQLLNGCGGPVAMGAAPALSAVWFPASQRTTATAIAAGANGLGVSISFIIGPLLVTDVTSNSTHNSSHCSHVDHGWSGRLVQSSPDMLRINNTIDVATVRQDIMRLMYIEFGAVAVLFLLFLLYFPSKPPSPPSVSASIERIDFNTGLYSIMKLSRFWLLALPYAIAVGVYNCWASVLNVNLTAKCLSQNFSGWLGFYCSLTGFVSGLLMGWFADVFKRHMKLYLLLLFSMSAIIFVIFSLAYIDILPFSKWLVYACLLSLAIGLSGGTPLFFELCCESTYPIAEGLTNGLLTWLNNLTGLVFLFVLMIPNIGTAWMNWCMVGSIAICIPILLAIKERYGRLDIDTDFKPGTVQA